MSRFNCAGTLLSAGISDVLLGNVLNRTRVTNCCRGRSGPSRVFPFLRQQVLSEVLTSMVLVMCGLLAFWQHYPARVALHTHLFTNVDRPASLYPRVVLGGRLCLKGNASGVVHQR